MMIMFSDVGWNLLAIEKTPTFHPIFLLLLNVRWNIGSLEHPCTERLLCEVLGEKLDHCARA